MTAMHRIAAIESQFSAPFETLLSQAKARNQSGSAIKTTSSVVLRCRLWLTLLRARVADVTGTTADLFAKRRGAQTAASWSWHHVRAVSLSLRRSSPASKTHRSRQNETRCPTAMTAPGACGNSSRRPVLRVARRSKLSLASKRWGTPCAGPADQDAVDTGAPASGQPNDPTDGSPRTYREGR